MRAHLRFAAAALPRALAAAADYVRAVQYPGGAIPWTENGPVDPWNHVEAAMGLTIAGHHAAAVAAYVWLAERQLGDGSWWALYDATSPIDTSRRESHCCAYIATGVWHHYRASGDHAFLAAMWPSVAAAIDFVLTLQSAHGEIDWALRPDGRPAGDALVTGCSSIYFSLVCAEAIAAVLGQDARHWRLARTRLGAALRTRPDRFDRSWESKRRYAMDWFYPILTGVVSGAAAQVRLAAGWPRFVLPGLGCRCVADQPWVTVAESCELVMALHAAGRTRQALELFGWLHRWQAESGGYWTGYQFELDIVWPEEQPTWTAGAVLLAADALFGHTAARDLFAGGS